MYIARLHTGRSLLAPAASARLRRHRRHGRTADALPAGNQRARTAAEHRRGRSVWQAAGLYAVARVATTDARLGEQEAAPIVASRARPDARQQRGRRVEPVVPERRGGTVWCTRN